jgi:hypothetical protein
MKGGNTMRVVVRLAALSVFLIFSALLYDRWQMRDTLDTLPALDPMPHTEALVAEGHFAEAEAYLGYFIEHNSSAITPQARERFQAIHARRQSWEYRAKSLVEGAVTGESDEVEGMIGAGVADLFVVGDIRDAVIQGRHWLNGEEVDQVIVALSSLGIVATAATIGTAGGAGGVKGSVSLLKQMRKAKLIPAWLIKALARLPRAADVQRVSNALLEPITALYRHSGLIATRQFLRTSKSLDELKRMRFFAKTFKRESAVLLRIDPSAIRLAEHFPSRTITRASLHGKPAFKQLARKVKYMTRVGKIVSKQWRKWIQVIPLWGLLGVWMVSLYVLLPTFRRRSRA